VTEGEVMVRLSRPRRLTSRRRNARPRVILVVMTASGWNPPIMCQVKDCDREAVHEIPVGRLDQQTATRPLYLCNEHERELTENGSITSS
jgi:hypothetical protein